jgi:hypothetical protein
VAGRIRSVEKSHDLIGNRNRDLPACSLVPQPTTLPRAHFSLLEDLIKNSKFIIIIMSRGSSVGTATEYRLDIQGSGVRFPSESRDFSLFHIVQTGSEAHPASYRVGSGFFSLEVKRQGCETDHSLPVVPRLRMCEAILPLPIRLHGAVLS